MITNYRKRTRKQAVAGVVLPVLLLVVSLTTYAEQKPQPIPVEKAKLIGYVEDWFLHNPRDITMRRSLEWGDAITDESGNGTIRYRFEALVRDTDRVTLCEDFTFDKDGFFTKVEKVEGFLKEKEPDKPVEDKPDTSTKEGLQRIVEKYFSTLAVNPKLGAIEWGEPKTLDNGDRSIEIKHKDGSYEVHRDFTFTKDGMLRCVTTRRQILNTDTPAPSTDDESEQTLEKLLKMQEMLYGLKKEKIQIDAELLRFDEENPDLAAARADVTRNEGDRVRQLSARRKEIFNVITVMDTRIKELELEMEHAKAVMQLKRDFGPQSQVKPKDSPPSPLYR
jgi:hypothetical protein